MPCGVWPPCSSSLATDRQFFGFVYIPGKDMEGGRGGREWVEGSVSYSISLHPPPTVWGEGREWVEGSVSFSISLHPPPTVWGEGREGVGGGECVLQYLSPPSPHCVGGGGEGVGGGEALG